MSTTLITGANRGLGLELARQYLADGWTVIACCRDPEGAAELKGLSGDLTVHGLDVADPASVAALPAAVGDVAIDVLLNNAGIFSDRGGFGSVDYEAWLRTFEVNTLGPLRVTEALVDHVARSDRRIVANMTSKMGSIADNTSGGCYAYRSSKAALNMVNASLAHDLGGRGITCVVLHPGWVATDMGGAGAPLGAVESCRGLRDVIAGLTPADTGRFFAFSGEAIPW